ncbi:MAG: hypothetical protein IJT43_03695 [Stomatobaculum sp.]|nr:hypothetical protein [Stomatobaculum sp.]
MKKWMVAAAAAGMSMLVSTAAFAAGWELGTGDHAAHWKYVDEDNNVFIGWHTIDGNKDGIAEWYYLDEEGWLVTSGTTPDGYTVNEDGAWVVDGTVMTEKVETAETKAEAEETKAEAEETKAEAEETKAEAEETKAETAETKAEAEETKAETEEAKAETEAESEEDAEPKVNTRDPKDMPGGKYCLYNTVNNGVTKKLSINVLYDSYYQFSDIKDNAVTLLYTVTDTYGGSTQFFQTYTKQSDGSYISTANGGKTLLEINTAEYWIYVGEPDYSRGHIYLLESEAKK